MGLETVTRCERAAQTVRAQCKTYGALPSRAALKALLLDQVVARGETSALGESDNDDVLVARMGGDLHAMQRARAEAWVTRTVLEPQHWAVRRAREQSVPRGGLSGAALALSGAINAASGSDWTRGGQFRRLVALWRAAWDADALHEVPHRDLGVFVTRLVHENSGMVPNGRLPNGAHAEALRTFNGEVFRQLLACKFPASNKELFGLLKLPMVPAMDTVRMSFYDEYLAQGSGGGAPTAGFFQAFLEMCVPPSYMDYSIRHSAFIQRVANDCMASGIVPNRFLSMLLLKVYGKNGDEQMVRDLLEGLFARHVTNDTLTCALASALYAEDVDRVERAVGVYCDLFAASAASSSSETHSADALNTEDFSTTRWETRMIDALLELANDHGQHQPWHGAGLAYKLPPNPAPYYMAKFHLRRRDVLVGQAPHKERLLAMLETVGPMVEALSAQRLSNNV